MKHFRDGNVKELDGQNIVAVQDFSTQTKTNLKTGEKSPIDMTTSNVLGFLLADGNQLFLRPSGTEPKIKFYTMVQVQDGELGKKKELADLKIEKIEQEIHKIINKITE